MYLACSSMFHEVCFKNSSDNDIQWYSRIAIEKIFCCNSAFSKLEFCADGCRLTPVSGYSIQRLSGCNSSEKSPQCAGDRRRAEWKRLSL